MPQPKRKVLLNLGISLDGYIARPDETFDFLFMPKDYPMDDFMSSVDVLVMGRKTWEVSLKMGGFGPEGTDPAKTFVYSRTHAPGVDGGATYTQEPPAVLVERIRKQKGKHIWLMGGGEIVREFLRADMVDEFYLGIVPVLIGTGLPLFPAGYPQRALKLIEAKTYDKGMVSLRYARSQRKRVGTKE